MLCKPEVRVIPLQPHGLAFGGFELQMLNAMKASKLCGVNIKPLDFWDKRDEYNILHFWGLSSQHLESAIWAKRAGKKVFLSILTEYPGVNNYLRNFFSKIIGNAKSSASLLRLADGVSVVNEEQKIFLANAYGFPLNSIFVIPNIVEDIFFNSLVSSVEGRIVDLDNYIISTGNICQRKNQINLSLACINIDVPLLIIGEVLPGEEGYAQQLQKLVIENSKKVVWIKGLPPGSHELLRAYKYSKGFALVSKQEQQPISALEAAVIGKPLLLANRPYAKQRLYGSAALVDCNSIRSIQLGLLGVIDNPSVYTAPLERYNVCTKEFVGAAYRDAYYSILKNIRKFV